MARYLGTHFGTYEVEHDADGAPRLVPFRQDPAPSEIGPGLLELADHPSRIRAPMVRAGWLKARRQGKIPDGGARGREPFVQLGWDDALDLLGQDLTRVRAVHGNGAIFGGSYGWASAGRFHHAQSQIKRLLNLAGGFVSSVNTYSYGAAAVLLPHVLGPEHRDATVTAPRWDDIARETGVMLAFGGFRASNSAVESGGVGRHMVRRWLDKATANGMELVVLSPSRRDLPEGLPGRHLFVKPATDTAVLLGMAQAILAEGRADHAFLARCTSGHEAFIDYLAGRSDGVVKSPEWAGEISGLPAAVIRELALKLVSRPGLVTLAWSLQRAQYGEQPYWAAIALACLTGQAGRPGCGFAFGLGSVNSPGQPFARLGGPAFPQGDNPVRDFIPVARFADMLLGPGSDYDYNGARRRFPDIRLVYWAGGNPFHHHQDINRLRRALAKPETIVVHESHWTGMARHADIVLPSSLPTERDDIAVSTRDNWIVASRKIGEPVGEARDDHAICAALAARLGLGEAFTEGLDAAGWIARLYAGFKERSPEMPSFPDFWEAGIWRREGSGDAATPQHALERFVRDPEASRLKTPSGRIELFSPRMASFAYADAPGHAVWRAPGEWLGAPAAARWPLHLLSPQPEGKLHSQLDGARASMAAKRNGRAVVHMNPADAASRGIADGDVVRIHNARGACLAAAGVSADIMPSVAILPTGAWYDPVDPAHDMSLDSHGNPNMLTSDAGSSRLAQAPAPNTCLVEIERYAGSPVPVRAFAPPVIIEEPAC